MTFAYENLRLGEMALLGWLLRDAPAQWLQPMVSAVEGKNLPERRARLLSMVKSGLVANFPTEECWTWQTFREVMIDRLVDRYAHCVSGTQWRELASTLGQIRLELETTINAHSD